MGGPPAARSPDIILSAFNQQPTYNRKQNGSKKKLCHLEISCQSTILSALKQQEEVKMSLECFSDDISSVAVQFASDSQVVKVVKVVQTDCC